MLKKVILKTALILYLFSMIVFLSIRYLFAGEQPIIQWNEFQYILSTSISNAFVITTVVALVAAYNLVHVGKRNTLSFLQTFSLTFSPGTLAGLLSLISIFLFFYYIDPKGIDQLLQQYLDYSLYQAKADGTFEEVEPIVNSPAVRQTNLLSSKTFSLISLVILFFNFSLGLMFSFLWKVKNSK